MAKQTFTTGQVLSAAQVNALQANDYNTTVSTKTASYVLVAADVGTTIVQNVATANTVTVNTGLFAAGDTLRIQNIGAGIATVTAGTATVNTANSLALPQWGSGILYFTSASAAIFFPSAGAAAAAGMTVIASGNLSSTSTFTSIPSTYRNLQLNLIGISVSGVADLFLRINADTGSNYGGSTNRSRLGTSTLFNVGGTSVDIACQVSLSSGNNSNQISLIFPNYANTTTYKTFYGTSLIKANDNNYSTALTSGGWFGGVTAISTLTLVIASGTFTGTFELIGVQ